MRFLILAYILLFSIDLSAQKVEYRNDSLFVNEQYITAQTLKSTLDSLLNSNAKITWDYFFVNIIVILPN